MTETVTLPPLQVPAREIPVPTSISPEARSVLAMGMIGPPPTPAPALDDVEGWKGLIADHERMVLEMLGTDAFTISDDVEIEEVDLGGFILSKIRPPSVESDDRRVYLEIHGGGWTEGGGAIGRKRAADTSEELKAPVWYVDYRMPPDHPYPTPLDDCVSAYRALLGERTPAEIVIGGPSAGANLAPATVLRARDEGLPLPAGVILVSVAGDLAAAGDTWFTNEGVDTVLRGMHLDSALLYAGGHDLRDPYLSPIYGDFTRGFPPTMLISGTRDKLLSDTVRLHRALRRAEIDAELHVWEAATHAMFLGMTPEDRERAAEMKRFAERCWGGVP
jgi:epsilon-lactone hydrolase